MREITIAGRKLGDGHPPLICGEVGINHNGDLDRALAMITVAKEAGCDAVKFATLKAAEFCNPSHMITYRYQGELVTEPELEMFRRTELPDSAWRILKDEADRHGLIFFSTPQNASDLRLLIDVGVPCIKVGSDDLSNLALIHSYASHGLPLILSTGMADWEDIAQARLEAWRAGCQQIAILVCTSEYPCPAEHANLARITTLREEMVATPIGFSDHTVGSQAATVAAALGACYFEKHFTLDNSLRGPDHEFSANPEQLGNWVSAIREVDVLLGTGMVAPTDVERVNRTQWRRRSGQQIRGELSESTT